MAIANHHPYHNKGVLRKGIYSGAKQKYILINFYFHTKFRGGN